MTPSTESPKSAGVKKPAILSVAAWAKKNDVEPRQAHRWAKNGSLPTVVRMVETRGVLATTKKKDVKRK